MNEKKSVPQETVAKPTQGSGIARRRLLRAGVAAAPLALTLSGRSAMAANNIDGLKGLSPMAWTSLHPNGTYAATSHTVGVNTLGKSPGFWTPNKGKTFPSTPQWPVAPFDSVITKIDKVSNESRAWGSYPFDQFKDVDLNDPGFANGAKFNSVFAGGDSRSFSRILIDESAAGNVVWHFSAAYLNVLAVPGYAINERELKFLYSDGKLTAGGISLSQSEIKEFLSQTWETPNKT